MLSETFKKLFVLLLAFKFQQRVEAVQLKCDDPSSDTCIINRQKAPKGSVIEFANLSTSMIGLTINDCEMAVLVPKIFTLLPKLEQLVVSNNNIKILQPKAFLNAIYLISFDVSTNQVVVVKNKVFSKCSNLNTLNLSYNKIKMVAVNAFQGLTNLLTLLLNNNVIETLAANVFVTLTGITTIKLNNNNIKSIDKDLFQMNGKLDVLMMDNNQILQVAGETFSHLSLSLLVLSNNNITSFQASAPGSFDLKSGSLQSIYIGAQTKGLDCQYNQVSNITCDSTPLEMELLEASYNAIFNFQCIKNMQKVKSINLQQNKIAVLSKNYFINLKKLNSLDLSFNLLKKVKPQVFAALITLRYLKINKLANYKTVKTILPKLKSLALTSDPWNCSYITTVALILQAQKIVFDKNFLQNGLQRQCACNRTMDQILDPNTERITWWFKVDGCNN